MGAFLVYIYSVFVDDFVQGSMDRRRAHLVSFFLLWPFGKTLIFLVILETDHAIA